MRKNIIILTSCLVAAGAIAVLLSIFWWNPREKEEVVVENSKEMEFLKSISDLPGRSVSFGSGRFCLGYFDPLDPTSKTIYCWKEVSFGSHGVPNPGPHHRMPVLLAKDFRIVFFDPPVRYKKADTVFKPGYYDPRSRFFYEWTGVALSKDEILERSQDGENSVLDATKPVLTVVPIEVPMDGSPFYGPPEMGVPLTVVDA